MGFSRQEYWSGLSCPPPGDLPHPGIKPVSLKSHALARGFFTTSATWRETSSKKSPRAGPQLHLALFPYPVSWKGFQIRSDQISRSVVSDSLRPQESQPSRPPCPSPTPGVHWDSRPSSQWWRGFSRLRNKAELWTSCLYIRPPWGGSKVRRISSFLCRFPSPASGPPVKEHYSRFISLFPFSSTRFPSINLYIGFLCSPHL